MAEDSGYIYKVGDSEVLVSNQPRKLFGHGSDISKNYDADAYLGVTDSFCTIPVDKMFMWFPWNEGRQPIPEMFYACNRALLWWVHYKKIPKIHLFCDGGSHRSVTVFGAFLLTYFAYCAKDIVAARVNYNRDGGDSDPLEYIGSYLQTFPEDRLLFKVMGEDYLSRLEVFTQAIYRRVKDRYGDNNPIQG